MFKTIQPRVWAYDLEWVPDPLAGRLVYRLPDDLSELEVLAEMYRRGGGTEEDPQPFLKTSICRIVSVSALERRMRNDGSVTLQLVSLPHSPQDPEEMRESSVVQRFLEGLSSNQPQLVGFNSRNADLPILLQRAVIHGLTAPGFCQRPGKPWEGIDYFARHGEWHIDLKEIVSGWGKASPSLHELASQSGIPGKMEVDGSQVAELWLADDLPRIVEYNEFDALTTYLVWLRFAHLAGHFTTPAFEEEERRVHELLETEIAGERPYLAEFLDEWTRLRALVADR